MSALPRPEMPWDGRSEPWILAWQTVHLVLNPRMKPDTPSLFSEPPVGRYHGVDWLTRAEWKCIS